MADDDKVPTPVDKRWDAERALQEKREEAEAINQNMERLRKLRREREAEEANKIKNG
jgi:hypothetical protein